MANPTSPELTTSDGVPLQKALAKAERTKKIKAVAMVMPLLAFLAVTFILPIGLMLFRSVEETRVLDTLPLTVVALEKWDGQGVPAEDVFEAMVADLIVAKKEKSIGRLATRMNFEYGGVRSMFTKTARKAKKMEAPFKEAFIKTNKKWGERKIWVTIKRLAVNYTSVNYVAAVDRHYDDDNNIVMQAEERQVYVGLFWKTAWMAIVVTVTCLILGFPVAYLLANLPLRYSNLLMIFVLLPFWTSLLVRTTSWIVLLQTQGVLNDLMVWMHIIGDDGRIQLIYNAQGTVIAMSQILLPFMILPLYSVMKTISPNYMRAAQSLGAHRFLAYYRIYLPNTLPGIGAGCLLVFILAVGYYITPALVGGEAGQMISNVIAYHMQKSLNWGLGAALGGILLVAVVMMYWLYDKLVGVEKLKLG